MKRGGSRHCFYETNINMKCYFNAQSRHRYILLKSQRRQSITRQDQSPHSTTAPIASPKVPQISRANHSASWFHKNETFPTEDYITSTR